MFCLRYIRFEKYPVDFVMDLLGINNSEKTIKYTSKIFAELIRMF